MRRRILIGVAVAVALAVAFVFAELFGLVHELEDPPDDPAVLREWAQANNLLAAEDVEAVLGPGRTVTEGWIQEEACPSAEHDSLGVYYNVQPGGDVGECVIFETGEEVYAASERDLPVDASTERYEPAW